MACSPVILGVKVISVILIPSGIQVDRSYEGMRFGMRLRPCGPLATGGACVLMFLCVL